MKCVLIATVVAALGLWNATARADTASAELNDITFIATYPDGRSSPYIVGSGFTWIQVFTDDIPSSSTPANTGFNTVGSGSVHSGATGASASANIDTQSVPGFVSVLAEAPEASYAGSKILDQGFLDVTPNSTATISGTYVFTASDVAASTVINICFRPFISDVSTCASRTGTGSGTMGLSVTYVNGSADFVDLLTTIDIEAYAQFVPPTSSVPEPASAILFWVGTFSLAGLTLWRRVLTSLRRRPR